MEGSHLDNADRRTWTVREAARALGIGKSAAYEAVKTGDLPALRIGGRYVVPKDALDRLLASVGTAPPRKPAA